MENIYFIRQQWSKCTNDDLWCYLYDLNILQERAFYKVKHLGQLLTDDLRDNADIQAKSTDFIRKGVSTHWNGLLEWTTGLEYWTYPNC